MRLWGVRARNLVSLIFVVGLAVRRFGEMKVGFIFPQGGGKKQKPAADPNQHPVSEGLWLVQFSAYKPTPRRTCHPCDPPMA